MGSEFIEDFTFGCMIIEGEKYTDDLIILGNKVIPGWWRKRGHQVSKDDLEKVIEYKPDLLIIGTGSSGNMSVNPTLTMQLDFEVISRPTREATAEYNKMKKTDRKIAGAFHLTC